MSSEGSVGRRTVVLFEVSSPSFRQVSSNKRPLLNAKINDVTLLFVCFSFSHHHIAVNGGNFDKQGTPNKVFVVTLWSYYHHLFISWRRGHLCCPFAPSLCCMTRKLANFLFSRQRLEIRQQPPFPSVSCVDATLCWLQDTFCILAYYR